MVKVGVTGSAVVLHCGYETDQPPLGATSDLPTSPGHPFYARLTTLLDGHHFDRFVEGLCDRFYAPVMGRPSWHPGATSALLVGSFEGIDGTRMAWRATDSLAVRISAVGRGRGATRSFDDCAHAALDRSGDAPDTNNDSSVMTDRD